MAQHSHTVQPCPNQIVKAHGQAWWLALIQACNKHERGGLSWALAVVPEGHA